MRLLIINSLLLFSLHAISQSNTDTGKPSENAKNLFDSFRRSQDGMGLNQKQLLNQLQQLSDEQFKTAIALEIRKQNEIEDDNYAMHHRWRSFYFQYIASIAIFVLVIIIVLCGLFFSGWQFRIAMKQIQPKIISAGIIQRTSSTVEKQASDSDNKSQQQVEEVAVPTVVNQDLSNLRSELDISTSGIKVNSSILGVIILVISIAFFYLYILYVYPIKYVSNVSLSPNQAEAKSK